MIHKFLESHGRSIFEALTWKLIASVTSFIILYYQSGDAGAALNFSVKIFVIGLVVYYLHERIWNGIHWGKQHLEDAPQH